MAAYGTRNNCLAIIRLGNGIKVEIRYIDEATDILQMMKTMKPTTETIKKDNAKMEVISWSEEVTLIN